MDKKAPSGNPSRVAPQPDTRLPHGGGVRRGRRQVEADAALLARPRRAPLRRPPPRAAPITPKVLAEQLRELEADGLVERIETGPVPAPVIYRLTAYGKTVLPVVESVRVWGETHLERTHGQVAPGNGMSCGEAVA